MNPVSILFVLSLAGQLDSPRFTVRESAQLAMQSQPIAACWPAVVTLAASGKPEVSERASRWLGRQEAAFAKQWMYDAVNDQLSNKPWRKVDAIEKSQKDGEKWSQTFGPELLVLMREKFGHENVYEWDGYKYMWCPEPTGGRLGTLTFHIRWHAANGTFSYSPGDW